MNIEIQKNFKLLKFATTMKQPNLSLLQAWSVRKEVCLILSQSLTGQILLPQISAKTCLLYPKSYLLKRGSHQPEESRKKKIDTID